MSASIDKRALILNAGLAVMRIRGYNATGVKDIVAAAGIPKGSFYNYFDSKEDFAVEALRQVAEGNLVPIRRTLGDTARPPLQRLRAVFAGSAEHLKRHGRFECGSFLGTIAQEVADTNETLRAVADGLQHSYRRALADCLAEARAAGELDSAVDPETLAGFLFSAWEGALLQMKTRKAARPLDDFLAGLDRLRACERQE
jgi:TetR/AcrR family transcriptional repressor of nem operon